MMLSRRKRNLVVCTSFHGDGFRGNPAVIFDRLWRNRGTGEFPDVVWLSRNPRIVKRLQHEYGQDAAVLMHSVKGLRALNACTSLVMTHGTSDYPFLCLPPGANKIQTYHGLPTKRGEYMRPLHDRSPGLVHSYILRYRFSSITHFISSSPGVTAIFSARFGLPSDRFVEIGYPAYDIIVNGSRSEEFRKSLPENASRVILYAPTFRRKSTTQWFPFPDRDLPELARFLEKHNAVIALRAHPNESVDYEGFRRISNRFFRADHGLTESVESLIIESDVIVTDYSGIYLEGLLRDIPPVFIPYDRHEYERGFPFDYDEMTPGPHVATQEGFIRALEEAFAGANGYAGDRRRVRNFFFSQVDGGATDRTIRFLSHPGARSD